MSPVRNRKYSWEEKISNGVSAISLTADFFLADNFVGVIKAFILTV